MTGRTHDLAAFTALNLYIATQAVPQMTLATAFVSYGANMIGGLLPDIDDQTADIWDKVRGGNIFSRIVKPLIGKHRMVSHSVLGMAVAGYLLKFILDRLRNVLLVDMDIVWWSLMIGYFSHLVMDCLTHDGVPWLFPVPVRFGLPPFKKLRIKTGGLLEKALVFPGLVLFNGYLLAIYYPKYLEIIKGLVNR